MQNITFFPFLCKKRLKLDGLCSKAFLLKGRATQYEKADSECDRQLKVNYDLIEVSDGWCFSISQREFVQKPIEEVGKKILGHLSSTHTQRSQMPSTLKKFCKTV